MKLRSLLLVWMIGLCASAWAQEVDVATAMADTKTFLFDDNKSTVKGYIYAQLETQTSCCGEDRIYLEIKIDPSGYVLSVKSLTGKSECFRQAAMDIVKNIRWNASDFKGAKSVYFEIKPNIGCADGRENVYTPIAIFNNPMLNPEGTEAPRVAVETESDPIDEQVKQELIAATQGSDAVVEEEAPAPAPTEEVSMEDRQIREESFPEEQVSVELTPEPEDPPQQALPEPRTAPVEEPQVADQTDPQADQTQPAAPELTSEEQAIRQAQIEKLREEMEEARKLEERKIAELRRREERRKQREAAAAAAAEEAAAFGTNDQGGDDSEIWLPAEEGADGGEGFDQDYSGDEGDEDARLLAEIEELREQQRSIAERTQALQDDRYRIAEETRSANAEMMALEQEIAAREEEAERYREERELEDLVTEQQEIADQRQAEEEEYQRMMDEIRRLQEEADQKVRDLEAKKQEVERLAQIRNKRAQEIEKERQLREKERQLRIAEMRLSLDQGEAAALALGGDTETLANPDDIMSMLDLTAEADSEAIRQLAEMIAQMRVEIATLQGQIISLGGTPATRPQPISGGSQVITPGRPTTAGTDPQTTPRGTSNDGVRSAATDDSWKGIDIQQPGVDPSVYYPAGQPPTRGGNGAQTTPNPSGQTNTGTRPPAPTEFDDRRGYTNRVEQEHANVAGPQGTKRTYIGGPQAMKDLIAARLKAGNVCGLAQALFSVTVDPQGNVVSHTVLTANTATVQLQTAGILPTLKFTPADVRINQTIYLEFKADIACDGQERVNLQTVQPIINN